MGKYVCQSKRSKDITGWGKPREDLMGPGKTRNTFDKTKPRMTESRMNNIKTWIPSKVIKVIKMTCANLDDKGVESDIIYLHKVEVSEHTPRQAGRTHPQDIKKDLRPPEDEWQDWQGKADHCGWDCCWQIRHWQESLSLIIWEQLFLIFKDSKCLFSCRIPHCKP